MNEGSQVSMVSMGEVPGVVSFEITPKKVCFKKTVTIHSTVSLLWIVTVFFETDVSVDSPI